MSVTAERALEESVTFHTAKSFCWAWLLVTFSYPALAAPIYQETLQGNGETRLLIERSLNVAESGRYFLTLKNGDLGPRNIEQCESEDTVSAKRECLFENLNERIEQNFTRMRDALIHVNGVRVRHSLAPNERTITQARGLLKIPVELTQGVNTLKVDYLGYSTAKLHLDLEKAPETPSAPFARFLLNRITGNTTQEFRLNARESFSPEAGLLSYAWTWGDEADGFVPVPSTETLVTHAYQVAGTYHAKLVVTDTLSGLSSEFGIDLVVTAVNPNTPPENESPKPIIQWAVDPLNPMRVTFNASQSSDDGEITAYTWRFTNQAGQHTNLTGETLSYTFFNPGSYTVRLGVTDNLGKTAYQTRVISLAPLSELVHDEILLTQNNYFGTFETEAIYTENINIPEAKLGKIRIKNADGQDHPIQDCSLIALPEKIGCLYDNLVNRTYVQLYRVSSANIYVNGRKVTDSLSINKQKKDFETVVSLNQTNTIEIRVRGWPTAFVNVEIQALETNLPPVAVATHSAVKRGAPQTIEFQATQSTDPNDQVVSYRFQAKLEGASNWALDTDWQASGFANLTFPSVGRWQVLTSARDKFGAVGETENLIEILPNSLPTLHITYGIYTNQTPYRVQVRANSTDADGDPLLYNFAFSNGQTTGFQALNTAVSMFNVTGNQSVTVTVRDQNGGETVGTASFVLGGNLVPIASFSFASPRAGYAPHTVSFDASNSSDPDGSANDLQYFWNFGDGTTGTGKLVDHTFQLGGEHIVALTVLDPQNGAGSQSRAIFSWTNEPPVPRYTITAVPGTLQRIFDASASTPGDSAIQRYNFETGDGNFIVQTTPVYTHTYLNGGVYNTSLRVYDAEGDANITGQTITVFNGQKPAANINLVSADVVTPAVFVLNADGSATPNSGATLNGWRWTLPNGETRLGPSLTYETSQHGNFSITLEVRDSFGFWSDPVTQELSATSGVLPIARIETNKTTALVGEPIRFSGLTSSTLNGNANLVSYEWTTPSGSKLYGPEVDIGLSQPGLKTVTLVVTDSKGYVSSPASFQVNIVQPTKPIALFTLSDAGNTIPIWRHADGRTSHATSPGASIIGYEWRMQAPDALPSGIDFNLYGPEVDLLFDQAVTYTVSLRVFDSAGGTSDWASQTFGPLQNSKPVANLLPGSITVTAPAIINFSSFGSFDPDGHGIISYYWNMGDGWERYEPSLQHQYNLPGVYTVELAVQDSFGLWSDPVFATVTVVENQLPIPVITMQDDPGGNRFKKSFSALQSSDPDGTIVQYNWFLAGQDIFSNSPEVEYTFTAPGHYTMGLGIIDNTGGASVAWYNVEIQPSSAPVVKIIASPLNNDPDGLDFAFDGSQSQIDPEENPAFEWVFSDEPNNTHQGVTVSRMFSEEGFSEVKLKITNSDGVFSESAISFYVYRHQTGSLVASIEAGVDKSNSFFGKPSRAIEISELPAKVRFSGRTSSSTYTDQITYIWNFGDGSPTHHGVDVRHVYASPGLYNVQLTIRNQDNVESTDSVTIWVPESSCYKRESDTNCLSLSGSSRNIIDRSGSTVSLTLDTTNELLSSIAEEDAVLNLVLDSDVQIDLKGRFSISGNQLLVQTNAILEVITDGSYFTLELNGRTVDLEPAYASLKNLRVSAGELKVIPPLNSKLVEITGVDFQYTELSPTGQMTVPQLPKGSYTATAYLIDDSSVQRTVEVVDGNIEIDFTQDEPTFQVTSSQKMSSSIQSMSTDPQLQEALDRLKSLPWPVVGNPVTKISERPTANTFLSTASEDQPINEYFNACGRVAPFNVVTTSRNNLDTTLPIVWGNFLSNLSWLERPDARNTYKSFSNVASGESSIKVYCSLQSPSIMHQYFEWYRTSSKQQCCSPGSADCYNNIENSYAYLTRDYPRDDQPIVYKMRFRDVSTGQVVERSKSFTFNQATAAIGYSRNNMTSILGLPANNNVDGWAVPYEFEIPLPKGMTEIEYAVDASSPYPRDYQFSHNYFCWAGMRNGPVIKVGIAAEEPVVEIDPPEVVGPLSLFGLNSLQSQNSTAPIPNEHDSLLATPANNMWRLSQYKLFPLEIDNRTSGNTYPTSAQAYEVETKVRVEVLEYGTSKPNYQAVSKIAMRPISTYVPAGSTTPVEREGNLRDLTGLTCSVTATKTACEGTIRLSPSLLNIPQSDINEVKIDGFSITLKPTFYNQAGVVINTQAQVNNTLDLGPEWKKAIEVKAMYDISPASPNSTRRCPARYSDFTIAFGQSSLVTLVKGALNPLSDEGYTVYCNDASLPFGGSIVQTCTRANGAVSHHCKYARFPHQGAGHTNGLAIDTRYLYKNAALMNQFDPSDGAGKIDAVKSLANVVKKYWEIDEFCKDKQIAPYNPADLNDLEFKCQDNQGKRRFTGKECFMNRERLVVGQSTNPPPPESYWKWDDNNLSTLQRSQHPGLHCPSIPNDTDSRVSNYMRYIKDTADGLVRLRQLFPAIRSLFTFGAYTTNDDIALFTNWHLESIRDGTLPIGIANQTIVHYPLYVDGVQLNSVDLPSHKNESGHLDHLHLEAR